MEKQVLDILRYLSDRRTQSGTSELILFRRFDINTDSLAWKHLIESRAIRKEGGWKITDYGEVELNRLQRELDQELNVMATQNLVDSGIKDKRDISNIQLFAMIFTGILAFVAILDYNQHKQAIDISLEQIHIESVKLKHQQLQSMQPQKVYIANDTLIIHHIHDTVPAPSQ